MMKKTKGLSLLMSFAMLVMVFSGCGVKKDTTSAAKLDPSTMFNWNTANDSSDVPDWNGKQLNMQIWLAQGPNAANSGKVSTNDVVTPEIKRVTGISFDKDKSFDNGGGSIDEKMAKMISAGTYPHMAYNLNIQNLAKKDYLWRIDELIKKYCPNLMKYFGPDSSYGTIWQKQIENYGGLYTATIDFNPISIRNMVEDDKTVEMSKETLEKLAGNDFANYGSFYIRDDILKKLYPNAKTLDEIQKLYMEKGSFSKDDIMDVPLDSPKDFFAMLYKIKDLNIKEGDRQVYPFYTHSGGDNWPLLTGLGGIMGYMGDMADANYYTYWDKETKTIKYAFKEQWMKDILKTYSQLVKDGVASNEALVDNNTIFKEKLNNGLYATTYFNNSPDKKLLENKPYKYRKVYVRYPLNSNKYMFTKINPSSSTGSWAFFKSKMSEEDVIQALRMMDFMASDPGQKLGFWGPKSAGLFTEDASGVRQFKDNDLVKYFVYDNKNDSALKYNLKNSAWPAYPMFTLSKYHPKAYYTKEKTKENAEVEFDMGKLEPIKRTKSFSPSIWYFLDYSPEVKRFWNAKKTFEDSLTRVFTASSDDMFEKYYNEAVEIANKNGLTDSTLVEINKIYEENINKNYINDLKQ